MNKIKHEILLVSNTRSESNTAMQWTMRKVILDWNNGEQKRKGSDMHMNGNVGK